MLPQVSPTLHTGLGPTKNRLTSCEVKWRGGGGGLRKPRLSRDRGARRLFFIIVVIAYNYTEEQDSGGNDEVNKSCTLLLGSVRSGQEKESITAVEYGCNNKRWSHNILFRRYLRECFSSTVLLGFAELLLYHFYFKKSIIYESRDAHICPQIEIAA